MDCPHCGYDGGQGGRHCTQCGFALPSICLSCGLTNPHNSQFCSQCASPLAQAPSQASTAERRQITVLFSDVVSSTAMSQQLDPEDLRDLLRAYQAKCADVLRELDGYVAQYLGDGILAYFGYPLAHEDDARRAVLAALRIVEVVSGLETQLPGSPRRTLDVRVAVHTGTVVVGEMGGPGRREHLAVGETPNLAARLQSQAAPSTVIVSDATYRLTRDYFVYRPLGVFELKGFATPISCHQALAHNRNVTHRPSDRATLPIVDRESELSFLLDQWRNVASARGTIVALGGEAGIGKSRLVRALCEKLRGESHRTLECYCSPLFSNTALHPWIDLLERELRFTLDMPPEAKLRRLNRALKRLALLTPRRLALFAKLLSIDAPALSSPDELRTSPQRERQAMFECLLECLESLASVQPVLWVIEDVHWADPSTLELIGQLVARDSKPRIMVLVSHRQEFRAPWPPERITARTLLRMTAPDSARIVAGVVRNASLADDVLQEVVNRADGVPLYLEEITKAVLESREVDADRRRSPLPGTLPPVIPTSLQASLTARLDRLGPGKPLLQLAAVLGRNFNVKLLCAISDLDETAVRAELARLTSAEMLICTGQPPEESYAFKHALIQDTAYETLLRATRHAHHQRIAATLAREFPELASAQPELLARHYAGAGMAAEAVQYWALAGTKATSRSAYAEAAHAYAAAMEQLALLPPGEARDRQEIELLLPLGMSISSIKGYAAAEVEATYRRAYELCERYPDAPPRALFGLMSVFIVRSDRKATEHLASRIEQVKTSDPLDTINAHMLLGIQAFFSGNYVRALESLSRSRQLIDYDDLEPLRSAIREGISVEMFFDPLVYSAWCECACGNPQQALEMSRRALAIAETVEHPFSLALTLDFFTQIRIELGEDPEETQKHCLRELAIAQEYGFPFWMANCQVRLGLLEGLRGGAGAAQIRAGLELLQLLGCDVTCPAAFASLAVVQLLSGNSAEALATLEQAFARGEDMLFEAYRPRLLALRGRAHHASGELTAAEDDLRRALELAAAQGARWLELGIAVDLAQLFEATARVPEARAVLEPRSRGFADTLDLPLLHAARAALARLT